MTDQGTGWLEEMLIRQGLGPWMRRQKERNKRYMPHTPARRVAPTVGRLFCTVCGLRLKKSEASAICRYGRNRAREAKS